MKIKQFAALMLVMLALVSCGGAEPKNVEEPSKNAKIGFSNQNVEISLENGKAVVRGSFENSENRTGEYTVEYCLIKDGDIENATVRTKTYELEDGENVFEQSLSVNSRDMTVKVSAKIADETVIEPYEKNFKSLRILSIGNSFSVDAQQWLYGIAKDAGFDNIILGNLYVGGCSLEGHYNYYVNERASYTYYKNTTGEWTEKPDTTMLEGLTDEDWDYITLQQASPSSGLAETYEPHLSKLIDIIKFNKTNPNAEIVWHMTWAYASDSTYEHFKNYDYDQIKMYEAIVNATKEHAENNPDISFVIPSGTAVQNARNTSLGDTLCRDGFHLDYNYGRYLAGLTWLHKITGLPIDEIDYIPEGAFDEETLAILKECAKNAVANPFEITE